MAALRAAVERRGERFNLYNAGMMGDRVRFGIFPRDLLTAALMLGDDGLLRESLRFSAATIGRRQDPCTGEEPGRVLHEFQEFRRDGLSTRYNACETSHLFLLGAGQCLRQSRDEAFLREIREELRLAGEYIVRHIGDDLFWEDPRHCGAERYLLRATYWKDSFLPGCDTSRYPVAYALVQAQTVAALRALAMLTTPLDLGFDRASLAAQASRMVGALWNRLWDQEQGYPGLGDEDGAVRGVSSDGLHMLAYLCPGDVPPDQQRALACAAGRLATPYGFRTYAPGQPDYSVTGYHQGSVWPFEQWFIARGALVHGLSKVADVAMGVSRALGRLGFVEIFYWDEKTGLRGPGEVHGEGCDAQLWSVVVPEALCRITTGGEEEGHPWP